MTAWLVISAVIAGAIVSMQPAINAEFGRRGGGPLAAALTSFLGGVLVILIVSTLFRQWPDYGRAVRTAPWWSWLGGLLGAVFVTSSILLVPRLGATLFIAAIVTGQLAFSLIIDEFSLLGVSQRPASPGRLLGVAIMMVGLGVLTYYTFTPPRASNAPTNGSAVERETPGEQSE